MPAQIQHQPNNTSVLRISGTLTRAEFDACQAELAGRIDTGSKPRLLAILENFAGWERGADWNDLDFLLTRGDEIVKIAIVAEPQCEAKALAFAGAGFRRAPVKFFQPHQVSEAQQWLAE